MRAPAVRVGAVDLGASSGRVMAAEVGADRLELTEVARFPNGPVRLRDTLHWDVLALYRGILDGLRAAGPELDSVGIDSWGVDFGLLDATGALLGNPVHHRDARTDGVAERVNGIIPPADLYGATGVQVMPINTIYQLVAALGTPQLAAARDLLLLPDLLAYWLTGSRRAEVTNASTTGLLDVGARRWADDVARRVGVDPALFAPLIEAGERIGELSPQVLTDTGLTGPVPVIAVGSHDTASAVVGVPAEGERFAFISCGTWSLVGVELPAPVLTEASRAANFSNELGVDGTVRYLRNVMGLWLLQECLRAWPGAELLPLLDEAALARPFGAVIDAFDPAFLAPGGMPERIVDTCRRLGQDPPAGRREIVRCVLESLALAHRRVVREASALSGRDVDVVHVVGGGARNALLCQLTADACGLPVVAGPVEATALGNVLVQARALGAVQGDLAALRALLRDTQPLTRYEPRGDEAAWVEAERRLERTPARA
ncbi:rhamnulokinase [Pseudonocardia sp. DSM 110487]|uniref:rhamnulokinase n=1 Tax=Pseudonocardia sp. DSM 110487 TaxID=2865833 RepID=UPI001C6A4CEB|nr:rhamnulokinase family protein [Pseudonocardia sp. DSM 110487]QYN38417.1 rhamnulokinase [Pseudonocardia sp. DSM 110487]